MALPMLMQVNPAAMEWSHALRQPPPPQQQTHSVASTPSSSARVGYCFHTDHMEQYLLLASDEDRATFHARTESVFRSMTSVAKQHMQTLLTARRAAASFSSSNNSSVRTNSSSTATSTPNKARVCLVASEQRFIAALHKHSDLERRAQCDRTRDRTVSESFSAECASQQQVHSVGDARLAQIRADFYDGFDPHEGQIALFEMLCEQVGSRIYAEEWEREWRSICKRNRWTNKRLRLGFSSCIMPRRTGKTTVGARSGLAFAMNIPRWKGVIIGTSLETAAYTIDEMDKQFYLCARAVRDFKFVRTAAGIAMCPYSDPRDVRTWITIPGEVRAGVW